MKKLLFFLVPILFIIAIWRLGVALNNYKASGDPVLNQQEKNVLLYLQDVYGRTFLIPEFSDINEADEQWLWENVNQYIWNHEDDYKEQITEEYGFTYDEILKISQKLYGSNLKKTFPKGAVNMRYSSYDDMYGVTAYSVDYYYDYQIAYIKPDGDNFVVAIYDYVVSSFKSYGNYDNDDHDNFDIFNIYDFELNGENATPIISFKDFKDKEFKNLLDQKDKLSLKTITFGFDEGSNSPYIISCKYNEVTAKDILSTEYRKVIDSFDIRNIEYEREDVYEYDELEVENFDELASIYTDNGKELFKNEYNILEFKDDGKVFIRIGEELDTANYLSNVHFENIEKADNKITAKCIRTFRGSFDPGDEAYNDITTDEFTFTIIKENNEWLVDKFKFGR